MLAGGDWRLVHDLHVSLEKDRISWLQGAGAPLFVSIFAPNMLLICIVVKCFALSTKLELFILFLWTIEGN